MRRRFVRGTLNPVAGGDAARGHRCKPHPICKDFAQIFVELVRLVWSSRERKWRWQAEGATARGHRCHTHPICENVVQMLFDLVRLVRNTTGRKCCCACLRVCVCVPLCMCEGGNGTSLRIYKYAPLRNFRHPTRSDRVFMRQRYYRRAFLQLRTY